MDSTPTALSISTSNLVMAVSEVGLVSLWTNPMSSASTAALNNNKKKKKKVTTKPADSFVKFVNDQGKIIPIIQAAFIHGQDSIMTARGSPLKPIFERIDILDAEGLLKSEEQLCIVRQHQVNLLGGEKTLSKKASKRLTSLDKVHVLGPADIATPTPALSNADMDLSEPTLQDLVAMETVPEDTQGNQPAHIPNSASLHTLLVQALTASDNQLLEKCYNVADKAVILATVKRIPVNHVIPLINSLVTKFLNKPNRMNVIGWLKTTLTVHVAYLMTVSIALICFYVGGRDWFFCTHTSE